jgi:hypothetical protein
MSTSREDEESVCVIVPNIGSLIWIPFLSTCKALPRPLPKGDVAPKCHLWSQGHIGRRSRRHGSAPDGFQVMQGENVGSFPVEIPSPVPLELLAQPSERHEWHHHPR